MFPETLKITEFDKMVGRAVGIRRFPDTNQNEEKVWNKEVEVNHQKSV